jgi:tRNA pseudouridine38-40 synthase
MRSRRRNRREGGEQGATGFSARFDATSREYRYRIVVGCPPLFLGRFAWHCAANSTWLRCARPPLRLSASTTSVVLRDRVRDGKRTVRRVDTIELRRGGTPGRACLTMSSGRQRVPALDGAGRSSGRWLRWGPVGRERRMGRPRRLAACSREAAGPTAPAMGSRSGSVEYPDPCGCRRRQTWV